MLRCVLIALVIFALVPDSFVSTSQAQPSKVGAAIGKVTVVKVSGPAQKMNVADPKRKWEVLREGDELSEMTLIRTGLRAELVLRFEDRGQIAIKGPAKLGISEFRKGKKGTWTRLGLKYGTVRASVDRTRGPHDFKVVTPVATLSVRGSRCTFSCLPDNNQGLKLGVDNGNWNTSSGSGDQNSGPGESGDNQGTHNDQINQNQGDTEQGDGFGENGDEKDNRNKNGGGRGNWLANGDGGGSWGGIVGAPGQSNGFGGGNNGNGCPDDTGCPHGEETPRYDPD